MLKLNILVSAGSKILMIKALRIMFNCGLKEAKDMLEGGMIWDCDDNTSHQIARFIDQLPNCIVDAMEGFNPEQKPIYRLEIEYYLPRYVAQPVKMGANSFYVR